MVYFVPLLNSVVDVIFTYLIGIFAFSSLVKGNMSPTIPFLSIDLTPLLLSSLLVFKIIVNFAAGVVVNWLAKGVHAQLVNSIIYKIQTGEIKRRNIPILSKKIAFDYDNAIFGYVVNRAFMYGELALILMMFFVSAYIDLVFTLQFCLMVTFGAIILLPNARLNSKFGRSRRAVLSLFVSDIDKFESFYDSYFVKHIHIEKSKMPKRSQREYVRITILHQLTAFMAKPLLEAFVIIVVFLFVFFVEAGGDSVIVSVLGLRSIFSINKFYGHLQQVLSNQSGYSDLEAFLCDADKLVTSETELKNPTDIQTSDEIFIDEALINNLRTGTDILIPKMKIKIGECLLIKGASGVGKSTYIYNLLRINRNQPLSDFSSNVYNFNLSYTSNRNLTDTGFVGDKYDRDLSEFTEELLTIFGLAQFSTEIQLGIDRGKLSSGERMRFELLEELLTTPDCLIIDEGLSLLNEQLAQDILKYLRSETYIKFLIIVDHTLKEVSGWNKTILEIK